MARLPTPGQDNGNWGTILNDYLSQSLTSAGAIKSNTVGASQLQDDAVTTAAIADNAITETLLSSAVQTKLNDTSSLADGSVTTPKIASGGLAPSAITGTAVVTADSRLINTRVPVDGSVTDTKITSGGLSPAAITGTAVITTDTRLTNTRTPTDATVTDAKIASGGLTNAAISTTAGIVSTKLSAATQTSLGKADSAVQTVNGISPTSGALTLTAANVSAIPTSEKGASGGVATLTGTTLTTAQIPSSVITKSASAGDTGKAIDAYTGAPLVLPASTPQAADYIIDINGSTIRATPRTGSGYTAYSGTDAYTVIQAAISALTVSGGGAGSAGGSILFSAGTFNLTNELTITGWEGATLSQRSQIILQGAGAATVFVQNTSAKNGLVIKNGASFALVDLRINAGANAKSALLLDKTGTDLELSSTRSLIQNVILNGASTTQPTAYFKNFFDLVVPKLYVYSANKSALRLENDSSTTNYGNSHFGLLRVQADTTTSPNAGIEFVSVNSAHILNLITIDNLECVYGYYGVYAKGVSHIKIAFADVEYSRRPIYLDGDATGFETRQFELSGGYLQANGTDVAVTQVVYTGGNTIKAYISCDANTTPISDSSIFRPVNDYDVFISTTAAIANIGLSWTGNQIRIRDTSGGSQRLRYPNYQSGTTYTLQERDADNIVQLSNAAINTVTVPPNSSVAFPVGTVINISQAGAGQTTIAAGAGVTLRERESKLKLAGQYATAALMKVNTNEWYVSGDLTT